MYINIELFEVLGLAYDDLIYLAAIHQKNGEWLQEKMPQEKYERFKELDLIKHVKAKNKQEHPYISVRLSDKATKFLTDLTFEGVVDQEVEVLMNWLVEIYKSKSNGIIKNKTEAKRRLHWFKTITQIRGNHLALLLKCFILDCYSPDSGLTVQEYMAQNPRGVLNNMLDNICFSQESMFDKHKTLDKSPLWKYFQDNIEYVKEVWRKNNLEV